MGSAEPGPDTERSSAAGTEPRREVVTGRGAANFRMRDAPSLEPARDTASLRMSARRSSQERDSPTPFSRLAPSSHSAPPHPAVPSPPSANFLCIFLNCHGVFVSLEIKSASVFPGSPGSVSPVRASVRTGAGELLGGGGFSAAEMTPGTSLEAVRTCEETAVRICLQQRCTDITQLAKTASAAATGTSPAGRTRRLRVPGKARDERFLRCGVPATRAEVPFSAAGLRANPAVHASRASRVLASILTAEAPQSCGVSPRASL